MTRHSKISMRVAGLENMALFGNTLGLKELGKLSKSLKLPQLDIEFSVGRSRSKELPRKKVVQLVKKLLNFAKNNSDAMKKLAVTGNDDDDAPSHPINLLEYCMEEVQAVPIGTDRQVQYGDRKAAVRDAYLARQDDLEMLFAAPEGSNV